MSESATSHVFNTLRTVRVVTFAIAFAALSILGAEQPQLSLDEQEQLDVQRDLYWLSLTLMVLLFGLLIFAYSIRHIARLTTRPCHWCMEFISKKAAICPRCGKKVVDSPAPSGTAAKPT